MTIKEKVAEMMLKLAEERLEGLCKIGVPDVVIEGQKRYIDTLKKGTFRVGGDTELLDIEVENLEIKKGRGGKGYVSFNNGTINFFPQAAYGMYIKSGR